MNPKISIVIPVYNGSNFLKKAIDSALAQTYKNIEIIVVNDGSNDRGATEEIVKSYGRKIRYFSKKNGGTSSALNLGIKKMKGDYFVWLSHDDEYLPEKIARQVYYLKKWPGKVILYSDFEFINSEGKILAKTRSRLKKTIIYDLMVYRYLHGCTILIPKKAFDEIGLFNEDLRNVLDYELWYRFIQGGYQFKHVPEILVKGRIHPNQDSRKRKKRQIIEEEELFGRVLKDFSAEAIFGTNKRAAANYLKLASFLEKLHLDKASRLARALGQPKKSDEINILVIPSWYPTKKEPIRGDFFKEQALAIGGQYPKFKVIISRWQENEFALSLERTFPSILGKYLLAHSISKSIKISSNVWEFYEPTLEIAIKNSFQRHWQRIVKTNEKILKTALKKFKHIDIIHAYVSFPAGYIAMELSKRYHIPYIISEVMGPFPFQIYTANKELFELMIKSLKKAHKVLAISPALQKEMGKFGIKSEVVPFMVNESYFEPKILQRKSFTFFSLGNICPEKGMEDLIRAIPFVLKKSNIILRIGGQGKYLSQYERLVKKLAIDRHVQMLGPLSKEQVKRELQTCQAFVLPSHHESFGMVYVEALASGKPIIATRCGGPETIVTKDNGLLVPVGDINKIAKAMISIVDNIDKYDPSNIRKEFLTKYSRKVVSRRVVEIYKNLIDVYKKTKILFLVSNNLTHDPRVQKQLSGASRYGYEVIGLGWVTDPALQLPLKEKINGYRIERILYHPAKIQIKTLPFSFGLMFLKIYKSINRISFYLLDLNHKLFSHFSHQESGQPIQPPSDHSRSIQSKSVLTWARAVFNFFRFRFFIFDFYTSLTILFSGRGIQIQPQIVHANDLDTLWAGYQIKKKTGAKLVYDAHEFWTDMNADFPRSAIIFFRIIEKILIRKVDVFVSVNQSLIDKIGQFHQVDFRRLGILTAPIYNSPPYQKVKRSRNHRKVRILYQGRFEPERGLEELIKISDKIINSEIYFRGYGVNEAGLRALVEEKKVKNLKFLSPVKMEDLVKKASFADIGILPYLPTDINHLYCSPNKLFEYMMAGLALAVSDLPELRRVVKKYQNGILFNPRSPKSIARALNFLINQPKDLAEMKKNSLRAAQDCHWENEEKKLVALYRQILSKKND